MFCVMIRMGWHQRLADMMGAYVDEDGHVAGISKAKQSHLVFEGNLGWHGQR